MPNIRLKAATNGGLALDVLARTASSTHPVIGIALNAEPQDSEIALAADPIITQNIFRVSANALSHEIYMTYEAIPVVNLPAETVLTSDSIGPFIIGFNPTDTPIIVDAPAFDFTFNSIPDDTFSLADLPAFELGRPLDDSFSVSDSIGPFTIGPVLTDSFSLIDTPVFNVGVNFSDLFSLTDAPVFSVGFNPSDSINLTDAPIFNVDTNLSDSFGMSDVFSPTMLFSRQFTDSVSMFDQFAPTVTKPIDTDLSTAAVDPDPVTMSDIPAMTFGLNSLSDSAGATDSPAFAVTKGFTDFPHATDTQVFNVGLNSLADNFTVTDVPTFAATKGFSDFPQATDAPVLNIGLNGLSDSVSVSQNIVLQPNKSVLDSISASDNTYEIGAAFEGDGGLFNSATLIGSSPPFNEEFALQAFSN
tara:strand:- start:305 stop:1555 length:1251 start_codon:yes stop_codon:yes gene_type:complete